MNINGIGLVRNDFGGSFSALAGKGSGPPVKGEPRTASGTPEPDRAAALPPAEAFDKQELDRAVDKLNQTAQIFNKQFNFSIHEETERIIVKVLNKETGEVLTEIPPEKLLDMLARIQETVGILIDESV